MSVDRAEMPGDAALLAAWERSRDLPRPWRELALLEAVDHGGTAELARLPLGERDRRLLELWTSLAGTAIECETDCPACGERLGFELEADQLRVESAANPTRSISHGGRRIRVRPPDSTDVAACAGARDPEAAIIARCADLNPADLTDDGRATISRTLAALDPAAELLLGMSCPACDERWQAVLDPASLAFEEVARQSERLLREVDQLARAYGWPEREVLALSPARRRAYVGLTAQ